MHKSLRKSLEILPRFNKEQKISLSKVSTVAKWSKALLLRERINENLKIPGSPPAMGNLSKQYHAPYSQTGS